MEGGLYRLNVDSGALQLIEQSAGWLEPPSISPRGDLLGWALPNGTGITVSSVASPNTSLHQVPGPGNRWSPDGNWLAGVSSDYGGYTVSITPATGGLSLQNRQAGGFYSAYWLPDSASLLVVAWQLGAQPAVDRTQLVLVSAHNASARPVEIPALDPAQHVVVGVSWRPPSPSRPDAQNQSPRLTWPGRTTVRPYPVNRRPIFFVSPSCPFVDRFSLSPVPRP